MTRLLLAGVLLGVGIAMIAPFMGVVVLLFVAGDLLNLLGRTLNRATEAASRAIRHLAAIVEGDQP